MALKSRKDYLRVIHSVSDKPFLVVIKNANYAALRKEFPESVIYMIQELAVMRLCNANAEAIRITHKIKEDFLDSKVIDSEITLPEGEQI